MKQRLAFTMLELVFVIVIMGILGKFGTEFLAQAYKSFIFSSINNNLQSSSASAVEFIAKRLENRIKDSVIVRLLPTSTPVSISSAVNGAQYTVLEWVGADVDGYRGNSNAATPHNPNWSGIIDLFPSNNTLLKSPGTDTAAINSMIQALSGTDSSISDAALYFLGSDNDIDQGYGWDGNLTNITIQKGVMHPIQAKAADEFESSTGVDFTGIDVYEYYKLAWTAYSIVYKDDGSGKNKGNLTLYYNYQPWNGVTSTNATAKSALLAEDVSTFRAMAIGSIIKIQVCTKSSLIENEEYSLCKEKTIF